MSCYIMTSVTSCHVLQHNNTFPEVNADPILIPAPTQGYQVWGFGEIAGEFSGGTACLSLLV